MLLPCLAGRRNGLVPIWTSWSLLRFRRRKVGPMPVVWHRRLKESVSVWPNSNPAPRPAASLDVEKRIRVAFVEDDDDYREAVSAELANHGGFRR